VREYYVPGLEEKDPNKIIRSLMQAHENSANDADDIATNTADIVTNTADIATIEATLAANEAYDEATLANASAITLTTNTAADIITDSLDAGDYDVWGVALFTYSGTTVASQALAYISSGASNTMPSIDSGQIGGVGFGAGKTGGQADYIVTPTVRMLLASTTTVRLGARGIFTTSNMLVSGTIKWRLRRS